jgi:hydroxyethylthiazole kinase-like uncharacterized protein yjeF
MSTAVEITPELLREMALPSSDGGEDKNARGRLLVLAGSRKVPGAAVLCGLGALRAGAGKLQMAATAAYAQPLAFALPESMVVEARATRSDELSPLAAAELGPMAQKADAVVIGPGLLEEGAAALACALMAAAPDVPFVIDAAALTGLSRRGAEAGCHGRAILTPHPGEMASLMDAPMEDVEGDPQAFAHRACERFNAVVAMKGRDTYIAAPDGRAWVNRDAPAGLAVSGSGDVLAGVIGGLLARGASPETAAVWGVWLHAQAGWKLTREVGKVGFLAREVPGRLPSLLDASG